MEPIHLYEGISGSCIISSNFRFENNFNEIIFNANLFKRDIIENCLKNYLKFLFYNKTNDKTNNYLSDSYDIMNELYSDSKLIRINNILIKDKEFITFKDDSSEQSLTLIDNLKNKLYNMKKEYAKLSSIILHNMVMSSSRLLNTLLNTPILDEEDTTDIDTIRDIIISIIKQKATGEPDIDGSVLYEYLSGAEDQDGVIIDNLDNTHQFFYLAGDDSFEQEQIALFSNNESLPSYIYDVLILFQVYYK